MNVGYGLTTPATGPSDALVTSILLMDIFWYYHRNLHMVKLAVKLLKHVSVAGTELNVDYAPGTVFALPQTGSINVHVNDTGILGSFQMLPVLILEKRLV